MKLLGWMHRKLRQNSGEQVKDFISGQGLLDDQQYYPKPNFGNKFFKQHHDSFLQKSFTGLETAKSNEEEDYGEESAAAMSELFHGFLAIGTLGSDHGNMDPATPTFAYSVDYITEKETDVTEDELKLINDELEKVLSAESESSGRNSYVSTGRSSYGSTITLGGKSTEGQESGNVCPLQEYLFGAAVELSASEPPKVVKKEHRASLGELFQRTKMTDESSGGGYGRKAEREEGRSEKDSDKSVMTLVKKKLKKKILHASSKSSAMAATASGDSNSAEAKIHKILHMFHRKVHPEYSAVEKESAKHRIYEAKKKSLSTDHMFSDEDIMIYPRRNLSKKSIRRMKSQSNNATHYALGEAESDMNRELWIKTDADYLVLEL